MQIISNLFKKYEHGKVGLSGLTDDLLVVYIKKTFEESNRNIIIVMNTLFEANKIYQLLLKEKEEVLLFPMDDFLTSEALAISPDLKVSRLETINTIISSDEKQIVITHLMGLLRYLPLKSVWLDNIFSLNKGQTIKKEELIKKLYNIGYVNETIVSATGEMATRGYIVDIFPIKESNPIRIEFWGDEIESIRYFDLDTQLSIKPLDSIKIYPFDEFIADDVDQEMRKQKYLPTFTKVSKISDYLDNPIIVYNDYNQLKNTYMRLAEETFHYHIDHDNEKETNYMHDFEKIDYNDELYVMSTDNILPNVKLSYIDAYGSRVANCYEGIIEKINAELNNYLLSNKTVIICFKSRNQLNNFISFLNYPYVLTDEANIQLNKINIIQKDIALGYEIGNFVVLGENNLFKASESKGVYKSQFKYGTKIKDLSKLNVGDYVVHQIHGVGVYCGIETITKNDIKKDYIKIKYRGNDKLYIPVEKINLIWKYSSNEGLSPSLNQLGGIEWQKTKLRIKTRLQDIAGKLLKIAAERAASKGFAYSPDTKEQVSFEKDFIYDETKDQLVVTKQIKTDMESETPMDRLLCGDVGYGKTEVAFRAAFKAIQNNKQVAILCPTTILSNQHYINALDRFKNFAINIAILNRFTTEKETKKILDGLARGTIDLLIGTHRILSKDIIFKDLGLLIVDEEQRFGVTHKEKILELKANIDVLTLSATPIPRTLQISMLGIRDLSLIETPPMNRFPIQTYVLEYSNQIIKEAIYKELSRGGQVFLLYNKVVDIEEKVNEIQKIVPDARITFAHGQMSKQKIEDRMLKFIAGDYDVLICTTIIETGIDIPNVNTLIITDADRFGLSQLYQIRGRVGRSNKIAYAYLMYNNKKVLNEAATKRLNVIKEFTALGSGFSIALRDLSIRGAGDILGSEQAGFIDSVGIELYLKMLNEEVAKLKGLAVDEETLDEIDEKPLVDVETHIEDDYIRETELKIEVHKRINEIESYDSYQIIKGEIEDRFGKIPESINIYMLEEWFERLAKNNGVEKVNQSKERVELILSKDKSNKTNVNNVFMEAMSVSKLFRVTYGEHRLKIVLDITKLEKHWLYYFIDLLAKI